MCIRCCVVYHMCALCVLDVVCLYADHACIDRHNFYWSNMSSGWVQGAEIDDCKNMGWVLGVAKKVMGILVYKLLQQALANCALLPHSFHCWGLGCLWTSATQLCIRVHICFGKVSYIWDYAYAEVFRKVPADPQDLCIHCFAIQDWFRSFLEWLLRQVFLQHMIMVRSQCWVIWHALIPCCSLGFSASHWWRSLRCNASSSKHVQTLSMSCSCWDDVRSSSYIIGFTVTPLVIRSRCEWAAASRAIRVACSAR